MTQPYVAALYMRLSRDDESYGDSVSIETQRTLLRQYAQQNQIVVYDEYVDDGFSGTSFNRPSFKRMLGDIESGNINCVITKDLSRFGREHVQMDYYLEYFFPEHKIRYVAVTENEDSEQGLSDFVPFKNLFNEWYAKDTSRKIKAAYAAKFKNGEYVHNIAPYGYRRAANGKRLEINPETAPIVRNIFDWAANGDGTGVIANRLRQMRVMRPIFYNGTKVAKSNCADVYYWRSTGVRQILQNPIYKGDIVHYRLTSISYKNKKVRLTRPDEQLVISGQVEPLVNAETFDWIQTQLTRRTHRRIDSSGRFRNVYCPICGFRYTIQYHTSGKKTYVYYRCVHYEKHAILGLSINEQVLREAIRIDLLDKWKAVMTDEEGFAAKLYEQLAGRKAKVTVDVAALKTRKQKLEQAYYQMYQDKVDGTLSAETFKVMAAKNETELAEINNALQKAQEESERSEVSSNISNWITAMKKFSAFDELTLEMMNALIDKVFAVKIDANHYQFKVQYRFVGSI